MKRFEQVFKVDVVVDEVKKAFRSFVQDFEDDLLDDIYGECYETRISTLVVGSLGCHIPSRLCNILEVTPYDLDEDVLQRVSEDGDIEYYQGYRQEWMLANDWIDSYEWIHDYVISIESKFCEVFNMYLNRAKKIKGSVYLGYSDSDGDYCLFYSIGYDDVEEVRNKLECDCKICSEAFEFGAMVNDHPDDVLMCPACGSEEWEYSY